MRGRVLAVLILLLLVSPSVFPQCSFVPRYSAAYRTTAYDVSVSADGYLWVATGYGVSLFELPAGGTPQYIDSIALPGSTRVVLAGPNGIAWAGSGSRLFVIRRDGTDLVNVRSQDLAGTINDIVATSYLFVATSTGIAHFDLIDPANPVRTGAFLATSAPNVTSLSISGTNLYAADGDLTVEVFTIATPSLPQHTAVIEALPRSTAVHALPNGTLFVSDAFGQAADLFSGSTRLTRLPFGATSLAISGGDVRFFAGPDRIIRAADVSNPSRVAELFEASLSPTDGTDNVIHAMAISGGTLYVAAGDIGLAVLDVDAIARPYPMAGYITGATTSVVADGNHAWISDSGGKVTEYTIDPAGVALVPGRVFSPGGALRDVSGNALLVTSGSTASVWSLAPQTPSAGTTATFRGDVKRAVVRGDSGILALLSDRSLWLASPALQQVTVPATDDLARAGSSIALAEAREDGKTVIRYYTGGDFAAAPRTTTIDGLPIGNLAMDATRAAVFTFSGINVVDLESGTARVIAGSNAFIPKQLAFAGNDLLALTDRDVHVFTNAQTFSHTMHLTADAVGLDVATAHFVAATSEGALAASWSAQLPAATTPLNSAYYTDMTQGGTRLALSSRERIDLYSTADGLAPHYVSSLDAAGLVDIALVEGTSFKLAANGTVTVWSHSGVAVLSKAFDEGADAQPLSLYAVGRALWLSFAKGCQTGTCTKKTLVIDPATLGVTATLTGGVTDLVVNGTRAYVLTDLPDELRIYNLADPLHPAPVVTTAAPATANSVAWRTGRVYLLADKLFEYTEATLSPTTVFLTPAAPAASQRVRISGNCGIVTGRSASPELYDATTWAPLAAPGELPSPVRTLTVDGTRITFLTEHSLEIWTTTLPEPGKQRGVR